MPDILWKRRLSLSIRLPVTANYCKADGIVGWRACIDHRTPGIEHVEVRATHFSHGFDPKMSEIGAERLAAPRVKTRSSARPRQ
jgi:hypothetical protein